VLEQAVRQAAAWQDAGTPCPVAVNLSALQFHPGGLVLRVQQLLSTYGLQAQLLELELTESILIEDADEALARMQELRALGVRLALDDFGTGYSSLSYLKRFPLQQIKIDRSFVATMHSDAVDAAIVTSIIQLARALKMDVVAEGVELEAQRQHLRELGCDQFQGFLCSRAVPASEFQAFLLQPR